MREASYRFLKVKDGVASFAEATVAFKSKLGGVLSISDSIENPNPNAGEVDSATEPEWVAAAISGMRSMARHLGQETTGPGELHLISLVGTTCDTTEDAVSVAAALATFRLFRPGLPLPAVSDGRPWSWRSDPG